MYSQNFLTCHNFHQPRFELTSQAHYISLPETLVKGLRKLLRTCQRHHTGIAVGSLLSFLAHCSRVHSLRVSLSGQSAVSMLPRNEPAICILHPATPAGVWEYWNIERDQSTAARITPALGKNKNKTKTTEQQFFFRWDPGWAHNIVFVSKKGQEVTESQSVTSIM